MLNDKRIKACISRYDNGAYSRTQFLVPVRHSMGHECQIQRWFVLTAYGNISLPYSTVSFSGTLPPKTCRSLGALWGFLIFLSKNIFHIHVHVGLFNWYSCLHFPDTILDCHLITPAFSTPAIWYRVFHSRAFQSPPYDTQPNACRLVPIPRFCFAVSIYNA